MALFCFWFRRACSRYAALGAPIPPGSRLEAHLSGCSQCRERWDDLRLLASDLDRLLAVPQPSWQFAEPIRERVKPTARAVTRGRASLAAAAACGLACGWMAWRAAMEPPIPSEPETARLAGKAPVAAPGTEPVATRTAREVPAPQVTASGGNGRAVAPETPHRRARGQRLAWRARHAGRQAARAQKMRETALPALPPRTAAEGWRSSGLALEARGDPGLANAAYQAAYCEHPTEEAAFDVGRTAEESGDMEQALLVYARLLDSADLKSREEKGWTP